MTRPLSRIKTITVWELPRAWLRVGYDNEMKYETWCQREAERITAAGSPCRVVTNRHGQVAVAPADYEPEG